MIRQPGLGVPQLGTTAEDYTSCYFASHLGSDEEYSWGTPAWREFFTTIADRIVALTSPQRTLDVGCAKGLLVQALALKGVDAFGTDMSETAVAAADPEVAGRLGVASAVDPIEGAWDLVTCIEVLEHMSPTDAERAMSNMCAVTNQILFSSGPGDFSEPTHVNVRPLADWVAGFAERGFFRRMDIDLSFLTPWAVFFERAKMDTRELVHRYESYAYPLRVEVLEKRAALLDAHRTISTLHDHVPEDEAAPPREGNSLAGTVESLETEKAALRRQVSRMEREIGELKHRLLTSRDHAIGAEASTVRAKIETARVQGSFNDFVMEAGQRTEQLEREIAELKASERWRIGGILAKPAAVLKRGVRR